MKNQPMADAFADVMKTVRMEPATRADIAVHAGITLDTADRWIKRLSDHGMLAPYGTRTARNGVKARVWAVTKAWGGPA